MSPSVRVLALAALALLACEKSTTMAPTPSAKPSAPQPPSTSSPPRSTAASAPPPSQPSAPATPGSGPFLIDEAADVGPSGPASAHESGVVLIDKLGHVAFAKQSSLPIGATAGKPSFVAVERPREDFHSFARGPALVGGFAYWIQDGNLVRARIPGNDAAPEVLVKEARKGARVVGVAAADGAPIIGFISVPDANGAPHAKLWSNGKVFDLTPEGAGASSIALVSNASGPMAITLDGRSGMTPLHARQVRRDKPGSLALGPDVVAWVGASAQATTEVFAAANGDDVWAFVPIEQDLTHFGLAQIHIGSQPRLDAPAHFLIYQTGTNSAPVATGQLCGRAAVAFAEPDEAKANAPQRLVLAALGENGLEPGEIVARGRAFAHVGLGATAGGALLVYTADHRTWARSVRCRDRVAGHSELHHGNEKR